MTKKQKKFLEEALNDIRHIRYGLETGFDIAPICDNHTMLGDLARAMCEADALLRRLTK